MPAGCLVARQLFIVAVAVCWTKKKKETYDQGFGSDVCNLSSRTGSDLDKPFYTADNY